MDLKYIKPNQSKSEGTSSPYSDGWSHLLDELKWLNYLIAAQALRLRSLNFYENIKDFKDFFITDNEIDELISTKIFEGKDQQSKYTKPIEKLLSQALILREKINDRIHDSIQNNIYLPLMQLSKCFQLSEFELQILIICIAPHIDVRYEKLYAYLQNDISRKFPSIDLVFNLLNIDMVERLRLYSYFHPSAPLKYFYLIEEHENGYDTFASQRLLRVNSRVFDYLLNNPILDHKVQNYLRFLPPLEWHHLIIAPELKNQLQHLFKTNVEYKSKAGHPVIFHLHGKKGIGKKSIAQALCFEFNILLTMVDLRTVIKNINSEVNLVRIILREGLLQPCAILFEHLEILEKSQDENPALLFDFFQEIQRMGWIIFLCSEKPLATDFWDIDNIVSIKISEPGYNEQKLLWKLHFNGSFSDDELDTITNRYDLTGEQIKRAALRSQQLAWLRNAENIQISLHDLLESSRLVSRPQLSTLARKIDPHYQWEDLILASEPKSQLRELTNHIKHRQLVMGKWNFAQRLTLGQGLNALFAGPSGTGKTMAAEVIANELGLDLYKIDLSAVVSKYIGETEKNLNRIFSEAENSNAILFFDEADALLGKRSEVKDAHDRYANIEIAYLLQKMEEFKGITILATNLRQNIDEAFTRRIRFIVEFPFPDEKYRLLIWQCIFPPEIQMDSNVDFQFLARQFKLSGGNIRNIALSAAFLAANDGKVVTMTHLIQATRREFQKMGKSTSKVEFGEYYDLI